MKIRGIDGLSLYQINEELQNGGKFVVYEYCVSILIMTYKRSSDIHLIRGEDSAVIQGLIYTFISIVLGWWGFPWGPIYTITSTITNCGGGKDVTQETMNNLNYNNGYNM